MKKILLIGGAGYIGSVLSRQLLEKGYKVRVFDRLYFGRDSVEELVGNPDYELVQGDTRDNASFPELLKGIYAVVYMAGLSNDPTCDFRPNRTVRINYEAVKSFAERCKKEGIKRFVFASSGSVYNSDIELGITEDLPINPITLYSTLLSKCEKVLIGLTDPAFSATILRQSPVFGLSPRMRFDLSVNVMTLYALKKKKIFVMGGGEQWRPFVHVSDTARAFVACVEAPVDKVRGEIFNVGSNKENYQIIDLAAKVKSHVPETEIEVLPGDKEKRCYNLRFDKIEKVLDFKAQRTVDEGIEEIVRAVKEGRFNDFENTSRYYNIKVVTELENKPAIEGGEPSSSGFLPFALPLIGQEEEEEVIDTLRSGWITTGPKTKRFEELFKEYVGCKYAVAVNSCTAALHLALAGLGIGAGDEVITTPVTFAATANVIIHCGAKPVFADINPSTLNIDPEDIEKKITDKTKAIIPVHMAGQPCDMDRIHSIAKKQRLLVVEDSAHALGAAYKGEMIGSLTESRASCFSFYPIKNITTIEGGMICTDDDELAEKARLMSLHGMSKGAWQRYSPSGDIHWDVVYPGYKYNMTDVQASLGLHQIKKVESFLRTRKAYAELYDKIFKDCPEIALPASIEDVRHAHHLYIIMLEPDKLKISRDEFVAALRAENIGTGIHFRSLHLHSYYRDTFGFKPSDLPRAAEISERIISLPLYPKMSIADVESVIWAVKKLLGYYRK